MLILILLRYLMGHQKTQSPILSRSSQSLQGVKSQPALGRQQDKQQSRAEDLHVVDHMSEVNWKEDIVNYWTEPLNTEHLIIFILFIALIMRPWAYMYVCMYVLVTEWVQYRKNLKFREKKVKFRKRRGVQYGKNLSWSWWASSWVSWSGVNSFG